MAKRLVAPHNVSGPIAYMGESYSVVDGIAEVPGALAELLIGSHGFAYEGTMKAQQLQSTVPVTNDDEDITDEEFSLVPTPEQFSAKLDQPTMKRYLASRGVEFPRVGKVGELRKLVEKTYAEKDYAAAQAEAMEPGFQYRKGDEEARKEPINTTGGKPKDNSTGEPEKPLI